MTDTFIQDEATIRDSQEIMVKDEPLASISEPVTGKTAADLEAATATKGRREEVDLTDQTNLLPTKRIVAVFAGLSLCALVSCLDSTIVATALPSISADFHAGSVSSWVPSSYLLTSTAFQPLCESCSSTISDQVAKMLTRLFH